MICIFHGSCSDGFAAAWAVRRFDPNATFIAGFYGQPPPDVKGQDVVLVDFSYPRPVLESMIVASKSLLVLDHHQSAREDLAFLTQAPTMGDWYRLWAARTKAASLFDLDRSGAMIAWDYFHPGVTPPQLLLHIQDRDLWRFQFPNTREISAAIASYPFDFAVWDDLMARPIGDLIVEGKTLERKHLLDVNGIVKATARRMRIGGYDVPVANAPYTWASDAGNIMAAGEPFAATYYDATDERRFSLRSTPDGIDVAAIAQKYGGGGHPHAAGFRAELGWNGDVAA